MIGCEMNLPTVLHDLMYQRCGSQPLVVIGSACVKIAVPYNFKSA
jgi:hypothetical protein